MTALALQRRVGEAGLALAVAAVAAASTWFVDDWGLGRGITAGAFVLLLAWMFTTRRTAVALAVLMVYLGAIDGYLKLSTGATWVTLVRDVLIFAIAAGALARVAVRGERVTAPPLTGWVVAF